MPMKASALPKPISMRWSRIWKRRWTITRCHGEPRPVFWRSWRRWSALSSRNKIPQHMEPERTGEILLTPGIHFRDQRGQSQAARLGDFLQHIPEFLLQRDAGVVSRDDQ